MLKEEQEPDLRQSSQPTERPAEIETEPEIRRSSREGRSLVKLPTLELPKFEGFGPGKISFFEFWDLVEVALDNNSSLSDV